MLFLEKILADTDKRNFDIPVSNLILYMCMKWHHFNNW